MKRILLLMLVALFAGTGSAQEAQVVFHPGEPIHILVSFKAPPANVDNASFYFGLLGQPDKAQALLGTGFSGTQFKKISDTQFELSGTIPDHVASGTFRLNWIGVNSKGVGKQYNEGSDFRELTVTIINPERPEFPAIDDVKLEPHK